MTAGWRGLLAGAATLVAVDHGPALRTLGVGRGAFVAQTLHSSAWMARAMSGGPVTAPAGVGAGV
ncbi:MULTISPECIES: hypothetical protein [Streptomyces]|uniref:hypothetical protein n=1 Tax=Streptomyces TaxID=1883 RepID=UPI0036989D4D